LTAGLAAMAPAERIVPPSYNVWDFGARGDGVTDDTDVIQAAVDAAGTTGGTLLFPPGTYIVTSVGLRPGVHYLGYGATIKRPPKQGKWTRTFDSSKRGYLYSGDQDSPPLTIEGLTFDGNRSEQGEYRKYQLEQAHVLFLCADPKRAGRLQVRILNCCFQDCVADAISLYRNVDAQIVNCTARDCFRGGLTVTGGYARVQVTNFTAQGEDHPTGIDVEVDGAGFGDTYRIELSINGLMLPNGDFDLGVRDGSIVVGTNIIARAPFHLYARDATVRITNSVFGVGPYSAYSNRIVYPGDVTFKDCKFLIDGQSGAQSQRWAAIHVYWNVASGQARDQSLKLIDCDFEIGSGIADNDTTYALYCEADRPERNNRLLVAGGSIPADFDYGAFIRQGGTVTLRDVEIQAETAMYLGSAAKWVINALIDNVRIEKSKVYAVIPTHGPNNQFTHHNVLVDQAVNIIETRYGLTRNRYLGGRIVLGEKPPTDKTHGLVGDVYRLKTPTPGQTYKWICTESGCGSKAAWKPLVSVGE